MRSLDVSLRVSLPLLLLVAPAFSQKDAERGSITGVVASAESLTPLNGALVTLRDVAQKHPPTSAVSGPTGQFGFADLPEGRYELWVSKSGYDARTNSLRYLLIEAGEDVANLTIQIWRQASINGIVTDSFGDPVEGVILRAFTIRHGPHGPRLASAGTATTDDLGSYRIYRLSRGDYPSKPTPPIPTAQTEYSTTPPAQRSIQGPRSRAARRG